MDSRGEEVPKWKTPGLGTMGRLLDEIGLPREFRPEPLHPHLDSGDSGKVEPIAVPAGHDRRRLGYPSTGVGPASLVQERQTVLIEGQQSLLVKPSGEQGGSLPVFGIMQVVVSAGIVQHGKAADHVCPHPVRRGRQTKPILQDPRPVARAMQSLPAKAISGSNRCDAPLQDTCPIEGNPCRFEKVGFR